ncbi:MAG: hypothetical protein QXO22_06195 [Thermosphaera sp.]
MSNDDKESFSDADYIPSTLTSWEYVLIIPYLAIAAYIVWYVSENLLVWSPNESLMGLPKPVTGAIIIAATWIIANFLFATIYLLNIRSRAEKKSREGLK